MNAHVSVCKQKLRSFQIHSLMKNMRNFEKLVLLKSVCMFTVASYFDIEVTGRGSISVQHVFTKPE